MNKQQYLNWKKKQMKNDVYYQAQRYPQSDGNNYQAPNGKYVENNQQFKRNSSFYQQNYQQNSYYYQNSQNNQRNYSYHSEKQKVFFNPFSRQQNYNFKEQFHNIPVQYNYGYPNHSSSEESQRFNNSFESSISYSNQNFEKSNQFEDDIEEIGRFGKPGNQNKKKKKKKKNSKQKIPPPEPKPKIKSDAYIHHRELDICRQKQQMDFVVCPFSQQHKMPQKRLLTHIQNCKYKPCARGYVVCPYNPVHWQRKDRIQQHKLVCPDRAKFQVSKGFWDRPNSPKNKEEKQDSIEIKGIIPSRKDTQVKGQKQKYEEYLINGDF